MSTEPKEKKQQSASDSQNYGSDDDYDCDSEDDIPLALLVGVTTPFSTEPEPLTVLDLLRPMVTTNNIFRLDTSEIRDWPFYHDEDGNVDYLDLENSDYYAVGTHVLEMACGGDWQSPMMVRIESDGKSLFVKECYKYPADDEEDNDDNKVGQTTPWPAWINERYPLNDEDVHYVVTGQYGKLDMDVVELTTEPTVLCRGSIPADLKYTSRNVWPPGAL